MVHSCIVAAVILLAAVVLWFASDDAEAESLIYPTCLVLAVVSVWLIYSWRLICGSFFDPYSLFLVAAVLFNGGHALLEALRLNEDGILGNKFAADITLTALLLVTVGLASLHLGALCAARAAHRKSRGPEPRLHPTWPTREAGRVGLALLAISVIPAVVMLRDALSVVMSAGYLGIFQRNASIGFGAVPRVLSGFLVPAALFLMAGSRKSPVRLTVSALVVLAHSIIEMFLGSRSMATMPLVAYAWLWHRTVRPVPRSLLLGSGAFLLIVMFPLVAGVRNVSGEERLSLSFLAHIYLSMDNPLVGIISEMGSSLQTVVYTIDLVPASRPYDLGIGYLYALLTVIPNFLWDLHPTVERGLAGDWLVWTVSPRLAALGGGLGFSFIAEAYLNFGWYGSPLVLGVIGYAFARMNFWAIRLGDPVKMAMMASFLSFFLFYARGELAGQIRGLLWYAVVPYLMAYGSHRFRRVQSRPWRNW